jgi:nucleoside-diphosphate-sugar epimerase
MNSKILLELLENDCHEVLEGKIFLLAGLKNESIFVTGGTGFMGTWITQLISFLNDNYHFNIKLFLCAENAEGFFRKAPHFKARNDITLISKDVRSIIEIPTEVSFIIHAAGNPDNRLHASDPLKTMQVIVNGTFAILDSASRLPNLKKFLNISSGLIYGSQPLNLPAIPESYQGGPDCNSVISCYAEGKRYAETLCSVYRSQFRMPIVTVRPFAFIGPYQLLDRPWAINNFIRDSLLGGTIRILGDGETIRSYMYPNDMTYWLLRFLIDGKVGLSYNLGSPNGISLYHLAEKIADNFPIRPKICSNTSNNLNLSKSVFVPDVSLAQKELDLNISTDIGEAIARTIMWNKVLMNKGDD